jgi:hypothetical protein
MVRGFVLAVRRYEAAVAGENAVDVYIALFEAFAWFDSLDERSQLSGTDEGRAMRFVRQRCPRLDARLAIDVGSLERDPLFRP